MNTVLLGVWRMEFARFIHRDALSEEIMFKLKSALAVSIFSLSFSAMAGDANSFVEFGYVRINTGTEQGNGLNLKGGTGLHKNIDFVAAFYHTCTNEKVDGINYSADLFNFNGGIRLKTAFKITDFITVEPFLPVGMMYSTGDVLSNSHMHSANSILPYYGVGSSFVYENDMYLNVEVLKYDYEYGIHGNVLYADPLQVGVSFGFRFA